MTYNVSKVEIPNSGVFYTARKDNRSPSEVVAQGVLGRKQGNKSPIYQALDEVRDCSVEVLYSGVSKADAIQLKKQLIQQDKDAGITILNVRL